MTITSTNKVILDGKYLGDFDALQQEIYKKNPEIVRKHRIKALYLGNNQVRFIADWELIIIEYYEIRNQEIKGGTKEGSSL